MEPESSFNLILLESGLDILFVCDIVISFMCPYERMDSTYEHNYKKIAKNYIFGSLLFDIIATFPTQVFESGADYAAILGLSS